jgi:hypothetical protein
MLEVIVISASISVLSCEKNKINADFLLGKWEGIHNNSNVILEINQDLSCGLTYFSKTSKTYESITGQCKFDYTKQPLTLSIYQIPQLNYSLHTIIDVISSDSIKISEFSSKWRLRPIAFEVDKTVILKRIKL